MTTIEINNTTCLNRLLRDELSALALYERIVPQVEEGEGGSGSPWKEFSSIQRQHREAANRLRLFVCRLGGTPDDDTGAWSDWADTVLGSPSILGNETALEALRQAEEYGTQEYREALLDADLHPDCKQLIRQVLLPRQREHAVVIQHLIERCA